MITIRRIPTQSETILSIVYFILCVLSRPSIGLNLRRIALVMIVHFVLVRGSFLEVLPDFSLRRPSGMEAAGRVCTPVSECICRRHRSS